MACPTSLTEKMLPVHKFKFLFFFNYRKNKVGLASMREDTPNPWETWGPRELGGLAGWGVRGERTSSQGRRRRNVMRNCWRAGWEGINNWTVKNKWLRIIIIKEFIGKIFDSKGPLVILQNSVMDRCSQLGFYLLIT